MEDAIIRLAGLISTQHRRPRFECLEGIHDHGEWLVGNVDRRDPVRRGVAVRGQYRRHFLGLIHHFLDRQDHLHVGHQGRHPVQVILGEGGARDDVQDAGHGQSLGGINVLDGGMRVGTADNIKIQHARQLDVIYVRALAPDKARVFLALDRVPHAADFW